VAIIVVYVGKEKERRKGNWQQEKRKLLYAAFQGYIFLQNPKGRIHQILIQNHTRLEKLYTQLSIR
jgi:hypothetical protein